MATLCAVDGRPVGKNYVHDQLYDLFYCQEHAHLSGQSVARICLNCGQKVADSIFPEPNCPSCGLNYKETISKAFHDEVGPILQRLKNYNFSRVWLRNLIAYGAITSLLFLIFHYAELLIEPVFVAALILLIFSIAIYSSVKGEYFPNVLMVLTFPFWIFAQLIKVDPLKQEIKMRGTLAHEDRIHGALLSAQAVGTEKYFFLSSNISILAFTISTYIMQDILSLEFLPILLISFIISLPITVLDLRLYASVGFPRIEKQILNEARYL